MQIMTAKFSPKLRFFLKIKLFKYNLLWLEITKYLIKGDSKMSISREEYVKRLKDGIRAGDYQVTNDLHQTIYQIDGINISGEYDSGIRGLDHNTLLDKDTKWEDILKWGTVVTPENNSYISDVKKPEFERAGFHNVPLNDNHIITNNQFDRVRENPSKAERDVAPSTGDINRGGLDRSYNKENEFFTDYVDRQGGPMAWGKQTYQETLKLEKWRLPRIEKGELLNNNTHKMPKDEQKVLEMVKNGDLDHYQEPEPHDMKDREKLANKQIKEYIDGKGGPKEFAQDTYKDTLQQLVANKGGVSPLVAEIGAKYAYEHRNEKIPETAFSKDQDKVLGDTIKNYKEPAPEVEKGQFLTKENYQQATKQMNEAFADKSGEKLSNYYVKSNQIDNLNGQNLNTIQKQLATTEGLGDKQPVLSSTLEKNNISYAGKKAIGALPVYKYNPEVKGKFESHIEPVFSRRDLTPIENQRLTKGSLNHDNQAYGFQSKNQGIKDFYKENHRKFKATGDPATDVQVAKNRLADYQARRELGIVTNKPSQAPRLNDLNLEKLPQTNKEQSQFLRDVNRSANMISKDVKKQIDVSNAKGLKPEMALNQNKQNNLKPKGMHM